MRYFFFLILSVILLFPSLADDNKADLKPFVHIECTLLISGVELGTKQIASYSAELPIDRTGFLKRDLEITNPKLKKTTGLNLSVQITPMKDEEGVLHLLVKSSILPEGTEKSEDRFRDIEFKHEGEQIMNVFFDKNTSTNLNITFSAKIKENITITSQLDYIFHVKIQRWEGDIHTDADVVDLRSSGGKMVSRTLTIKVPVLKEGKEEKALVIGESEDSGAQGTDIITIPSSPKDKQKKTKKGRAKKTATLPAGHIEIVEELLFISITPDEMKDDQLTMKIELKANIISPIDGAILKTFDESKAVVSANKHENNFYLLSSSEGLGNLGYAIQIIPEWAKLASNP